MLGNNKNANPTTSMPSQAASRASNDMGACQDRILSLRSKECTGLVRMRNTMSRSHSTVRLAGELTARGTTRVPATLNSVPITSTSPATKPIHAPTIGAFKQCAVSAARGLWPGSAFLFGAQARLCLSKLHVVAFRALHVCGQRCAATFAVHQIEASRVALQEHSEFDQADQYGKQLAAPAGEHILVAGALPRRLVRLLGQNPSIDKLFETRRRDLLSEAGPLRKVLETLSAPECLTQQQQSGTDPDAVQGPFDRTGFPVAGSVAVGQTTCQSHRVSCWGHRIILPLALLSHSQMADVSSAEQADRPGKRGQLGTGTTVSDHALPRKHLSALPFRHG